MDTARPAPFDCAALTAPRFPIFAASGARREAQRDRHGPAPAHPRPPRRDRWRIEHPLLTAARTSSSRTQGARRCAARRLRVPAASDLWLASNLRRSWAAAASSRAAARCGSTPTSARSTSGSWEGSPARRSRRATRCCYEDWQAGAEGFEYPGRRAAGGVPRARRRGPRAPARQRLTPRPPPACCTRA